MKKTLISFCLMIAVCFSFSACNKSSDGKTMNIPETEEETETASYSSGETSEELTEASALLQKSVEVNVDSDTNTAAEESKIIKELLETGDNDASISYQGKKTLELNADNPSKNVSIDVTTDAGIDFTGNLGIIEINSCKALMEFSGSADTIVLNNEDANCDISGNISNLIIYGRNTTVKFSGDSVVTSVLAANTTSVIINSTDSDMAVCLSNGVRVAVPAHSTLNVSDLTVAAHK